MISKMETKYGKVFIDEREIAANGKVKIVSKLLEDIRFSNLDHKWYDSDGKLSPIYEAYRGRPIYLQFKINLKDRFRKYVEFNAKVKLPFKLGELKPQDFDSIPTATQEMWEHWNKVGMLSNESDSDNVRKTLRDTRCATFVACLSHGCKISEMKVLHASCDPYFALDEFNDQDYMPFKITNLYLSALSDILAGNPESEDNLKLQSQLKNLPEKFSKLLNGIHGFRKIIAEKEGYVQPLIQAYDGFHDGMALEVCNEWKEKQRSSTSIMFKELHEELRMYCIGAYTSVEMPLMDKNIRVPKRVRESFLYKSLLRTYCKHSVLVNDMMSLKKEMAAGEPDNSVFFLHVKDGLSLQDAFQKTIDRITVLTELMNETCEMFINLYGEHPEAAKVVETIKGLMYGHFQWIGMCERYLPNMIYDFVVGL